MSRKDQNLIPGPIEGYKMVNYDLTCRGFQFTVGTKHHLDNDDDLELCQNGFHFCPDPSGVWNYYNEGRLFKVRAYGVLSIDKEPGSSTKWVCESIELLSEIEIDGDCNTGHSNTGHSNTGNRNTGNRNTGHRNTGDCNTGDCNTGDCNTGTGNTGDCNTGHSNTGNRNTGHSNTGNRNTGHSNTGNSNAGDCNTGHSNTGDCNTGDSNTGHSNTGHCNTGHSNTGTGNCGNRHTGHFNTGDAPVLMFDKVVKSPIDRYLVCRLAKLLTKDDPISFDEFASLPNITKAKLKKLHQAHISARKEKGVNK